MTRYNFKLFFLIKIFFIYFIICLKSYADNSKTLGDLVVLGPDNAPVKIKVFSSLTCSHCANFHIKIIPEINIAGIDLSEYALANAKEEIQPFLQLGNATSLPFPDNEFDLVICITTLHNLYNYELRDALREIERVGKGKNKYIVVESYETEAQKANFLYWQLTCRSFYKPEEWEWLMNENGYSGDYSCIVFD